MALQEIDCNGPGIRRRGAGKGFYLVDDQGVRIEDDDVVGRVRALAIPPAWTDVWSRAPAEDELLAYRDDGRGWVDVKSSDINAYLQGAIGEEFTAKDFRTWVGTVLAAAGLAAEDPGDSETARRRAVASVVKDVAEHLGNTPAVARSAYIDPRVVEGFERDDTVGDVLEELDEDDLTGGVPEELEQAVLRLIERERRARAREQRSRRRRRS